MLRHPPAPATLGEATQGGLLTGQEVQSRPEEDLPGAPPGTPGEPRGLPLGQ